MADFQPPLVLETLWTGDKRFDATSGPVTFTLDGDTVAGPSPTQMLAAAFAGCMSIDIVDILRKGRHPITGYRSTLTGHRRDTPPRRFLRFHLECRIQGAVPDEAAARAMELSREKYCSVWHSLREDIELTTAITIDR